MYAGKMIDLGGCQLHHCAPRLLRRHVLSQHSAKVFQICVSTLLYKCQSR
jgi:hypothetical protein